LRESAEETVMPAAEISVHPQFVSHFASPLHAFPAEQIVKSEIANSRNGGHDE